MSLCHNAIYMTFKKYVSNSRYLKQFVIGRPGYDNYLVNVAVNNKISLIDVTKTMTVIHQTGYDGNSAAFNVRLGF